MSATARCRSSGGLGVHSVQPERFVRRRLQTSNLRVSTAAALRRSVPSGCRTLRLLERHRVEDQRLCRRMVPPPPRRIQRCLRFTLRLLLHATPRTRLTRRSGHPRRRLRSLRSLRRRSLQTSRRSNARGSASRGARTRLHGRIRPVGAKSQKSCSGDSEPKVDRLESSTTREAAAVEGRKRNDGKCK